MVKLKSTDISLCREQEIKALYRINKFLEYITDLDKLLIAIMQEASRIVSAEASSIAIYDKQHKDLYFTVSLGLKGSQVKPIRVKLGQGILGWAAKNKKPLNILDVTKDKRFYGGIDKKTSFKSKSILAVPILRSGTLIGALEVINKKNAKSFCREDVRLLEIIAGQAAVAIENAQLYQRLIRKHNALKDKHRRLSALQQKMLLMERMSAIGDMASRMVHDLRNPLTAIRGYAELFKFPEVTEAERVKFSKTITDEVDRLTGMTQEVMDFAKGKTSFLFSKYSLSDFINEIADFLRRDFQSNNIRLEIDLKYPGFVYIDKYKMQRALFNLTYNARDAMSAGGIFKIETGLGEGGYALIKLSDTGPGIPEDIKGRLFEPFATSGKAHGTGLGLAIVKKIIESHQGSVSVESRSPRPNEFSTVFTLRVPTQVPSKKD